MDKGTPHKISTIIGIFVCVITLPILFINLMLITKAYLHPEIIPDILGYKPLVISSDSMESRIMMNDVVLIQNVDPDTLVEGHIIAYRLGNSLVLHRITDILMLETQKVFITKGDHNNLTDSEPVRFDQIEGVFAFRIPYAGLLIKFFQTENASLLLIGIPLSGFIIYSVLRDSTLNKQ
ncbi:MAG: signal peptidase I, partial [Eubacterium sp.]